jgi:mRNA interferase MazF
MLELAEASVLIRRADKGGGDSKIRPCVVISLDARNLDPGIDTVIIVPLTSDTDGRSRLVSPLLMPSPENGLVSISAAMCTRVSCLRKSLFTEVLGKVSREELRLIRAGVVAVIGMGELLLS